MSPLLWRFKGGRGSNRSFRTTRWSKRHSPTYFSPAPDVTLTPIKGKVTLPEKSRWRRTNNRKRRNESGVLPRRNTPPPKSGIRIKRPARTQRLIARRAFLRPPWLFQRPIPFPQRRNSPLTTGAVAVNRRCIPWSAIAASLHTPSASPEESESADAS
jgi:hypothetical protein